MHTKATLVDLLGGVPPDAECLFIGGAGWKLSFNTGMPESVDASRFKLSQDTYGKEGHTDKLFRFREK